MNGKVGAVHLLQNGLERYRVAFDTLTDPNLSILLIDRTKEWVTLNMIPMTVAEQQEQGLIMLDHPNAKFPDTGTSIEDNIVSGI